MGRDNASVSECPPQTRRANYVLCITGIILAFFSFRRAGLRLGKMIAKVGLVQLLQSFDFESVNGSEIEFDNYAVTLIPKGGVEIRVVGRQEWDDYVPELIIVFKLGRK